MATTPPRRCFEFDVWGCRGSRSYFPSRSRVGNSTSCYSLHTGADLFVFDAGRGISALGQATESEERFGNLRKVHVLVTHAHLDHWEGLKDVSWFWQRNNGLEVSIYGTQEALGAIHHGFAHPSYVPLEVLSQGTVAVLRLVPLKAGQTVAIDGHELRTFALNHASGRGETRRVLDTLGYRVAAEGGPAVAYLLDHEPVPETMAMEREMLDGTHLAVYDAHFSNIRDQQFGHGSQEHAAHMARLCPDTLVLAGHHGPMYSDEALRENFRNHARGAANCRLALEGRGYTWNGEERRFQSASPSARRATDHGPYAAELPQVGAKPVS